MKRLLHVKCTEHTDTPPFKDFSIKYYTIVSGYFYFRENGELGFFSSKCCIRFIILTLQRCSLWVFSFCFLHMNMFVYFHYSIIVTSKMIVRFYHKIKLKYLFILRGTVCSFELSPLPPWGQRWHQEVTTTLHVDLIIKSGYQVTQDTSGQPATHPKFHLPVLQHEQTYTTFLEPLRPVYTSVSVETHL